jgi:glycosyltransferase involved in cell wall biosynthesis
MRILQVANGYPHRAYGGVELHTHRLCAALRERGHDVSVFARHSDPSVPDGTLLEERVDGVRVRSVVNDFKGHTFRDHYLCAEVRTAFERTLSDWQPELVHFQHLAGLSADLPEASRRAGPRTVATVHEYWYACQRAMFLHADGSPCGGPAHASCVDCVVSASGRPADPPLASRVAVSLRRAFGGVPALGPDVNRDRFRRFRDALAQYQGIVTPSQFVIDEMDRHGMPLANARAISLGLETTAFDEPEPPRPLPVSEDRPLRLGFIGQHLPHKGPHVLLDALRRVPGLPLRADFHGMRWPDHPYDAALRSGFAVEPRALYRGRFPDGELPRVLAELDVLVVPSTCPESFGLVTREAHLAGRPVLSTDRGALPESIRDGEDGLLVPAFDAAAMAEAIRRLATDSALLARLRRGAEGAHIRVKSMDEYAAEMERELYASR